VPISTLGLALGGGAVLGAAHIGVLQAVEEVGLEVTHVSGTSMGALVATLFASGLSGKEIEALAEDLRWPDITGFSPSRLGLLSMERLESTLRRYVGDARMEAARIPIALVAADISSGEKVVMTRGGLATAAIASACVPGLFVPVEREGRLLVDGGLLENLPVSPLQHWEVDRIVAVDVHMGRRFYRPRNLPEVLSNALDMALASAAHDRAREADLVITPDTTSWSRSEMQDIPALVREGYRSARAVLSWLEDGGDEAEETRSRGGGTGVEEG
jgi:NTE family protein